jgi:outer membrane protein assembly factor BamB
MSITIRPCPSCGQANPAASLFCPNCGSSLTGTRTVNAPGVTEDEFFDIPAFLRDASRRKRRRRDPVGGAGWAWVGAVLIATPVTFSIEPPVSYGLLGFGILLTIAGFWQLRLDRGQLARAGLLTNLAALITLAAILARLTNSPEYPTEMPAVAVTATPADSGTPDWEMTAESAGATLTQGTVAMFRGDPEHTGHHAGPGPAGDPDLQWTLHTGGELYSSAAASGGIIYIGTKTGSLAAIDERTGSELWHFDLDDYVIVRSSPAVVNRTVYIGGGYALYAIDAETGKEEWRFAMPYVGQSSPTVAGGVVYASSQEGHLYAIDADTGEELWHFQIDGLIFSSPAVADGRVVIGSDDGNLYGIEADTGRLLWKFPTGGSVFAAPAIVDGVAYAASKSRSVFAVDMTTGDELWRTPIGGESSPAVGGGVVYVGSDDGGLYALDGQTGDTRWLFPTGAPVTTSPAVAGDTIYIASGSSLYAIDRSTGAKRWNYATADTIESSPTVVDGLVLIGGRDGFLYAIGGDGFAAPAVPSPATGGGDAGGESGARSVR